MRARGWALVLGLAHLADARDEKAMSAAGRATIDRALSIILTSRQVSSDPRFRRIGRQIGVYRY